MTSWNDIVQAVTTTGILDWVERMGGWAVVCFIVYWLTGRWEKRMTNQSEHIRSLTEAVRDQTTRYGEMGASLLSSQSNLERNQADIRKDLARFEGQFIEQGNKTVVLLTTIAEKIQA